MCMKSVFPSLMGLILTILLSSCVMGTIDEVTFTFENNFGETIYITPDPDTGEDWDYFEVADNDKETIESEGSAIYFDASSENVETINENDDTYGYTYVDDTRTYTFYDNTASE
jgi:hypothetical protein